MALRHSQGDELPYRTPVTATAAPTRTSVNENNYDTLKIILAALGDSLETIDGWHAFDVEEKELTVKQQIVAHRKAYEIILPAYEAVKSAMQKVDAKYKEG